MRIELDPEEVRDAVKQRATLLVYPGSAVLGGVAAVDAVVLHKNGSATVTFISYPGDEIEDVDTSDPTGKVEVTD